MVLEITEDFNIDGILYNIIISLCVALSDHSSQTSRLLKMKEVHLLEILGTTYLVMQHIPVKQIL